MPKVKGTSKTEKQNEVKLNLSEGRISTIKQE
jgi:hypothetical protein